MRIAFHENVKFCPRCGVDSLERDYHKQPRPKTGGGGEKGRRQTSNTEWVCLACGFGFKLGKSTRYHLAEDLIKRDRQLRNGVIFSTACVGQAVADAYVADNPTVTEVTTEPTR